VEQAFKKYASMTFWAKVNLDRNVDLPTMIFGWKLFNMFDSEAAKRANASGFSLKKSCFDWMKSPEMTSQKWPFRLEFPLRFDACRF
jgi:hypothetical protein